ncbi:GlxA family transcriptional regulator [Zooshikella ganghwensis]|uniref:Helix-turn-helix domain-containing protein n=1 Tax=Zooshikella ganghwensis TaxID=202772 RepID=A0A4P9VLZ2_9GAMM|nr:helix-turn-helix domain-containing protein [Zooshikella ganghwensis]RDH43589.1 helix-turn-helix domain-containing protein [Zooshikella ganghwensis]
MSTHITVLALPHMLGTSITLPMEILHAANANLVASHHRQNLFKVTLAGQTVAPITITGGLTITPQTSIELIDKTDCIVIPGLWRNPQRSLRKLQPLIQWLTKQYHQGATLCAAGTGVSLIAEAGLLDNKPATTHWFYFDSFQKHYPKVQLQQHHLITQAGRIYCAGSVNSMADLMIHFVGVVCGQSIATRVEQQFSQEIRRSFESVHYSFTDNRNYSDETVLQAQLWLQQHYQQDVIWSVLASQLQVSLRTFNRRFRQATNQTPTGYLRKLRLSAAKELLQKSNLTIAEISDLVGFKDESYFARCFKQQFLLSPSDFKRSVRGKLFSLSTIADSTSSPGTGS